MTKSKYGRPPERLVPCMPPLLDEETKPLSREDGQTKFGGTACELLVMNLSSRIKGIFHIF